MSRPMKRSATTELNSDNWDQEEEPEEEGTFKAVDKEELSKRVIKVARRRLPKPPSEDQKPIFSNFTGFGKTTNTVPDAKHAFSFLSSVNGTPSKSSINTLSSSTPKEVEKTDNSKSNPEKEYLDKLKSLNECLLNWINDCIKKNPSCVLTPIFSDYEKHVENLSSDLEKKEEKKEESKPDAGAGFKFSFAPTTKPDISKSSSSPQENKDELESRPFKPPGSLPSATSTWMSSSPLSTNVWSNLSSTTTLASKPGLFSSSMALTTTNSISGESSSTDKNENGDEDEPPVNNFKPVTEDDALFSQRVKVFIKSDNQFTDRGVGTLYIKETKDDKENKIRQAIVRADTSIGNILVNIRLFPDLPTKRLGKNNVMVIYPIESSVKAGSTDKKKPAQPTPVLLRVKTEEDADKLLDIINKYKQ